MNGPEAISATVGFWANGHPGALERPGFSSLH